MKIDGFSSAPPNIFSISSLFLTEATHSLLLSHTDTLQSYM